MLLGVVVAVVPGMNKRKKKCTAVNAGASAAVLFYKTGPSKMMQHTLSFKTE